MATPLRPITYIIIIIIIIIIITINSVNFIIRISATVVRVGSQLHSGPGFDPR